MPASLATTENEWKQFLKSKRKGFIRTLDDWKDFLGTKRTFKDDHPFAGCDKATIDAFSESLSFSGGGFAHANYGLLADKLSFRQFEALWARFGMSMRFFLDHQDYRCPSRGNCSKQISWICTSNCNSDDDD